MIIDKKTKFRIRWKSLIPIEMGADKIELEKNLKVENSIILHDMKLKTVEKNGITTCCLTKQK